MAFSEVSEVTFHLFICAYPKNLFLDAWGSMPLGLQFKSYVFMQLK
jgi:hypothetical protein